MLKQIFNYERMKIIMANVYDKIVGDAHVVCSSSLLKGTEVGHILSVKCHKDLDNGSIITRGAWVEAQVFDSADYAAGKKPYLVLTTPIGYNSDRKYYQEEKYFYNAAGEIARAYELYVDDIFEVSDDAITALATAPVVGNYVEIENGLYKEAAAAPESGIALKIIEKVNYTNGVSYRLHVESLGM